MQAAPDLSSRHRLTGSWLAEHTLKLGFGWRSQAIGESFAPGSRAVPAFLFVRLILAAWWKRVLRSAPGVAVLIARSVGWVTVSRRISYPFARAGLLWVLPFLAIGWTAGFGAVRRSAAWRTAPAGLIGSNAASAGYHSQPRGSLKPDCPTPLRELAARLLHPCAGWPRWAMRLQPIAAPPSHVFRLACCQAPG